MDDKNREYSFNDEEIQEMKDEMMKESHNDFFGFTKAINWNVLQDEEKMKELAEKIDQLNNDEDSVFYTGDKK
jgi:hypothetical protein